MSGRSSIVTTYEPENIIQPISSGGDIALDREGKVLATCLEEDAMITDFGTGQILCRIEGVRLVELPSPYETETVSRMAKV